MNRHFCRSVIISRSRFHGVLGFRVSLTVSTRCAFLGGSNDFEARLATVLMLLMEVCSIRRTVLFLASSFLFLVLIAFLIGAFFFILMIVLMGEVSLFVCIIFHVRCMFIPLIIIFVTSIADIDAGRGSMSIKQEGKNTLLTHRKLLNHRGNPLVYSHLPFSRILLNFKFKITKMGSCE